MLDIGIDLDDVVLDLVPKWIDVYNNIWSDTLQVKDIIEWNISKFVKPECGNKIYDLLTPELYLSLVPVFGSIRGISQLRLAGHKIIYITKVTRETAGIKRDCLEHFNLLKKEDEYLETYNGKGRIFLDTLIDDSYDNITTCRGVGILYTRPWNKGVSYSYTPRANHWKDVLMYMRKLDEIKNKRKK